MSPPVLERRRWPRLKLSSVPFLKSVTLSQGTEVKGIDISRGGMRIETDVRLRPLMKIHLRMVTSDGVITVDGSVVRSEIVSLDGVPRYQSAIAFDHPLHMLDDLAEEPAASLSSSEPGHSAPHAVGEKQLPPTADIFNSDNAVLTVAAPTVPSADLLGRIKLNKW